VSFRSCVRHSSQFVGQSSFRSRRRIVQPESMVHALVQMFKMKIVQQMGMSDTRLVSMDFTMVRSPNRVIASSPSYAPQTRRVPLLPIWTHTLAFSRFPQNCEHRFVVEIIDAHQTRRVPLLPLFGQSSPYWGEHFDKCFNLHRVAHGTRRKAIWGRRRRGPSSRTGGLVLVSTGGWIGTHLLNGMYKKNDLKSKRLATNHDDVCAVVRASGRG